MIERACAPTFHVKENMISERYDAESFLRCLRGCDLPRFQTAAEEELRQVDLTCRRAWNEGNSVPPTAPRYLNFLRRLVAWLDSSGETRVRLAPELRDPWRDIVVRLVETGQLSPKALRSLGRARPGAAAGAAPGSRYQPFRATTGAGAVAGAALSQAPTSV